MNDVRLPSSRPPGQKGRAITQATDRYPQVRVLSGDITSLEVDGFVYYARPDLQLGSGIGGIIRRRGGAVIQTQLDALAPRRVTEAVLSGGGRLGVSFIIHAVGPDLGDPEAEQKLGRTVLHALELGETQQARRVAIPPMGSGFFGISVETCAAAMAAAFERFFRENRHLSELYICCRDPWMVPEFCRALAERVAKGQHK